MEHVMRQSLLPVVSVVALARPCPALAQTANAAPDPLALVRSLGKPPVWTAFIGGYYGLDRSGEAHQSGGGGSSCSVRQHLQDPRLSESDKK